MKKIFYLCLVLFFTAGLADAGQEVLEKRLQDSAAAQGVRALFQQAFDAAKNCETYLNTGKLKKALEECSASVQYRKQGFELAKANSLTIEKFKTKENYFNKQLLLDPFTSDLYQQWVAQGTDVLRIMNGEATLKEVISAHPEYKQDGLIALLTGTKEHVNMAWVNIVGKFKDWKGCIDAIADTEEVSVKPEAFCKPK